MAKAQNKTDKPSGIKEITDWLKSKNKDYQEGLNLFLKHGKNGNLKRLFMSKESSYTMEKMTYELGKLAESPLKEAQAKIKRPVKVKTKEEGSVSANDHAEEVQSLINQKTGIFNKKAILSNKLKDAATDEERKAIVGEIDELESELSTVQEKLDHFDKTGSLPELKKAKELPEDGALLMKELSNARSRISKNKKVVEQFGKSAKGVKAQAKLDADEKLLKEIEAKIK